MVEEVTRRTRLATDLVALLQVFFGQRPDHLGRSYIVQSGQARLVAGHVLQLQDILLLKITSLALLMPTFLLLWPQFKWFLRGTLIRSILVSTQFRHIDRWPML